VSAPGYQGQCGAAHVPVALMSARAAHVPRLVSGSGPNFVKVLASVSA
jgi:hypothetical protein